MAVFEYKALNGRGKKTSGIIDADSEGAAKTQLRQSGLYPTAISGVESRQKEAPGGPVPAFVLNRLLYRINPAQVARITRQLSTLLSAGFPLVKALSTLVPQMKSRSLQKMLSKIKESVEQGNSFSEALSLYPSAFSPVYVNMVRAGESSGTLEVVLERLADFAESREETRQQIRASLAYPVLMTLVSIIVLVILITYVVPGIVGIFEDMNQVLPLPTRVLIRASDLFRTYWWLFLMLPVLAAFGTVALGRTRKGGFIIDWVLVRIPLAGGLNRKLIAARFTRTMASLLANGVPLLTALEITRSITGNRVFSRLTARACDHVEQGGELGAVLARGKVFPYLAVQMIRVGETSGELEKMLEKTADMFEKEVQAAVAAASALITPIVILMMGVVVSCIIFAVCMPIFEINQLIR